MKIKTFFTAITLALALVTTSAVAQDAQECIAMVSLFTEPAKAKNYPGVDAQITQYCK